MSFFHYGSDGWIPVFVGCGTLNPHSAPPARRFFLSGVPLAHGLEDDVDDGMEKRVEAAHAGAWVQSLENVKIKVAV